MKKQTLNYWSTIQLRGIITTGGIMIILLLSFKFSLAQIDTLQFEFEGLDRNYLVFLPENYQPNMQVVFNLHGKLYDANMQMDYSRMNEVADTAGFIVVYPNAIWPGFNSGVLSSSPPFVDTTINDVGFISAIIDTIYIHYNIDTNRVYCCGLSKGGQMTYRLTCQLGNRFAAVASVSGCVSDISTAGCLSYPPMPILHMHGTADNIVPYGGSTYQWGVEETLNFWLEKNACSFPGDTVFLPDLDTTDGCTVQKISYTNCEDYSSLIFYKVINGGHSWPGADTSYPWSNPTNQDINASIEIWNFFKDYPPIHCLPEGITFSTQEEIDNFQINYPGCVEIEGDATINGDDIDDLSGLNVVTVIGGDLNISSNNILNNLSGLDSLTSIGGNLEIIGNPVLSELSGLYKITSIGGNLEIIGNEIITSLSGLENIESESIVDLSIWGNSTLSECDIWNICYYINNTSGIIDIHDNATGCDTEEEVKEACLTSVKEINAENTFTISPNPLKSTTLIQYTLHQNSPVTIKIIDLTGQEIKTLVDELQQQGEQQVIFNTGDLPAGVYFCVLKTNPARAGQTKKIIKL